MWHYAVFFGTWVVQAIRLFVFGFLGAGREESSSPKKPFTNLAGQSYESIHCILKRIFGDVLLGAELSKAEQSVTYMYLIVSVYEEDVILECADI